MKRLALVVTFGLAAPLVACTQPGIGGGINGGDDDTGPPLVCEARTLTAPSSGTFVDISEASGIQAGNFTPSPATAIPINDHSRLAFIDLDGTRVTVKLADGTMLVREVKMTRGTYNGSDTRQLYFGFGDSCDYSAEVRWPDGTVKKLGGSALGIDTHATITY